MMEDEFAERLTAYDVNTSDTFFHPLLILVFNSNNMLITPFRFIFSQIWSSFGYLWLFTVFHTTVGYRPL